MVTDDEIANHSSKFEVEPERAWTNNVLYERQKENLIYYVPCYLRLKVKNFISLNVETLTAEINVVMIFTLFYGGLPKHVIK